MYFEAKTFLSGLLYVEDKISMAHGLETRVPFLDNDLVNFAITVPAKYKINLSGAIPKFDENLPGRKKSLYFQSTNDGKRILRDSVSNILPESITNARKKGFSGPDSSWFKGSDNHYVTETLFNPKAHIYDFFDRKTVKDLVNLHLSGKQNKRLLIWSFLNFETWLKHYGY